MEVVVHVPDDLSQEGKDRLMMYIQGMVHPVQELIRCKDCKHHSEAGFCGYNDIYPWPEDDWFCADGERK